MKLFLSGNYLQALSTRLWQHQHKLAQRWGKGPLCFSGFHSDHQPSKWG